MSEYSYWVSIFDGDALAEIEYKVQERAGILEDGNPGMSRMEAIRLAEMEVMYESD